MWERRCPSRSTGGHLALNLPGLVAVIERRKKHDEHNEDRDEKMQVSAEPLIERWSQSTKMDKKRKERKTNPKQLKIEKERKNDDGDGQGM